MSSREVVYYHMKKSYFHLYVGQEEQGVFISLTSFYISVATTWWAMVKTHAADSERKYGIKLEISTAGHKSKVSAIWVWVQRLAKDQLCDAKNQKIILRYLHSNFNVSLVWSEKNK